ncbi:hypothetical protein AC249_AIPGENE11794 [Exaiptasia diaphana]|nr:hypothetical protein AC249_AIPGENE11794 [Exaiptasia diaphana]
MAEKGKSRINRTRSNFVKRQEGKEFVVQNSSNRSASHSVLETADANSVTFNADRVPTFFPANNQTEPQNDFKPTKPKLWLKRKSASKPRSAKDSGEPAKPIYSDVVARRNQSASSRYSERFYSTTDSATSFSEDDTDHKKDATKKPLKGNSNMVHERQVQPTRGKNSYADDFKTKSKKVAFSNAADEGEEMKIVNGPKRKSRNERSLSGDVRNTNRRFAISNDQSNSKDVLPKDNKDRVVVVSSEETSSKPKEDRNNTKTKPKWNGNFSKDNSTRYGYAARNNNLKASGAAVDNTPSVEKTTANTNAPRAGTTKTERFQRREPVKSESDIAKAKQTESLQTDNHTTHLDGTVSLMNLDALRQKHPGCCNECIIARAESADVTNTPQDRPKILDTLKTNMLTSSDNEEEQVEGIKTSLTFINDAMAALQIMQRLIENVGSTRDFLTQFYDSLGKTRDVARCRRSASSSSEEIVESSFSDVERDEWFGNVSDEEDVDEAVSNEQVKTKSVSTSNGDANKGVAESHDHCQSSLKSSFRPRKYVKKDRDRNLLELSKEWEKR